jgi:hypothetical protein
MIEPNESFASTGRSLEHISSRSTPEHQQCTSQADLAQDREPIIFINVPHRKLDASAALNPQFANIEDNSQEKPRFRDKLSKALKRSFKRSSPTSIINVQCNTNHQSMHCIRLNSRLDSKKYLRPLRLSEQISCNIYGWIRAALYRPRVAYAAEKT